MKTFEPHPEAIDDRGEERRFANADRRRNVAGCRAPLSLDILFEVTDRKELGAWGVLVALPTRAHYFLTAGHRTFQLISRGAGRRWGVDPGQADGDLRFAHRRPSSKESGSQFPGTSSRRPLGRTSVRSGILSTTPALS